MLLACTGCCGKGKLPGGGAGPAIDCGPLGADVGGSRGEPSLAQHMPVASGPISATKDPGTTAVQDAIPVCLAYGGVWLLVVKPVGQACSQRSKQAGQAATRCTYGLHSCTLLPLSAGIGSSHILGSSLLVTSHQRLFICPPAASIHYRLAVLLAATLAAWSSAALLLPSCSPKHINMLPYHPFCIPGWCCSTQLAGSPGSCSGRHCHPSRRHPGRRCPLGRPAPLCLRPCPSLEGGCTAGACTCTGG